MISNTNIHIDKEDAPEAQRMLIDDVSRLRIGAVSTGVNLFFPNERAREWVEVIKKEMDSMLAEIEAADEPSTERSKR